MNDSKVVFGGKNGEVNYNMLIIKELSEYSKLSKNCVQHVFLSILRNLYLIDYQSFILMAKFLSFHHQ